MPEISVRMLCYQYLCGAFEYHSRTSDSEQMRLLTTISYKLGSILSVEYEHQWCQWAQLKSTGYHICRTERMCNAFAIGLIES